MGNGVTGNRLTTATMAKSGVTAIDTLFRDVIWALGPDRAITYSFPGVNGASYSLGTSYPNPEARDILTPTDAFMANVARALGTWSAVANVTFQQVADSAAGAGDIRFFITNQAPTTNSAFAMRPYNPTGHAAAGDVVFYNQLLRSSAEGTFNYTTIIHEVGHSLGLKHPGDYENGGASDGPYLPSTLDNSAYSIMSYYFSPKIQSRLIGPSLYDIQAIQYLYGANMAYAPGDQTYAVGPSLFRTIWDPNGVNGLSGQNINANQILNAQELSFSSADGFYTAAVAKGTKIHNLEGGNGSDTLIGNALDNRFVGGRGDDLIIGNGGADTVVYGGKQSGYTITQVGNTIVVKDNAVLFSGGVDRLKGITWLSFEDGLKYVKITLDPIGVAIADQLSVVYLGRGVGADWRDSTATLVANGASTEMLKTFYDVALLDRAFLATDSVQAIVNKTFLNIFGVEASAFEQNAWADTVTAGFVSREVLPWAMFNSYLGATNVPDSYKIPAQSRIIAANAFTNAVVGDADAVLGGAGVATAESARAWLLPIRSQADAAVKASAATSYVSTVTSAQRAGGPLEVESVDPAPDLTETELAQLVGVPGDAALAFGPSGLLM